MKCEDFYNYLRLAYCVHFNSASQFEDPFLYFSLNQLDTVGKTFKILSHLE